jgi:hypothetical protein
MQERTVTRGDQTYTINTANIGKRGEEPEAPLRPVSCLYGHWP